MNGQWSKIVRKFVKLKKGSIEYLGLLRVPATLGKCIFFLCTLFFTFFFSASLGECCGSWAGRSKKKRSSGPRLKIAAWPWLVLTWVPDYPSVHGVNASIPSGGQICRSLQDDFQEFQNFDDFDDFTLDGSPFSHCHTLFFLFIFFHGGWQKQNPTAGHQHKQKY